MKIILHRMSARLLAMRRIWLGVGKRESGSFLKKRTKKLLSVGVCPRPAANSRPRSADRSFLVLFFKKERAFLQSLLAPIAICLPVVAVTVLAISAADAETLRIASPQKGSWENSAPEWGVRLGYFKDVGLDLDVIYTNGGAESQQAVISGSMDLGIGAGILGTLGAQSKGAPITIVSNSYIGAGDSYWYVRSASPIRSLQDTVGKTIGFSVPGSSTNLTLLALLRTAGVPANAAKPTPTGNPVTTLTQVMSGQIDVGWAVTPFLANELDRNEVRIIARGADAPELRDQSVRISFVNNAVLESRRDAVKRFMRALRRTMNWMYSDDPRVLQWYADGAAITPQQARTARDTYDPQTSIMPGPVRNLALSEQQALDFKYLRAALTPEQRSRFIEIFDGTQ